MDDPIKLKEQIVAIFKSKGPSIPVRIAKEINMSPLFASAFLSELLSEKTIKTSYMRMGGTPIYLIQGQEPQLEQFAEQYLKSKEKDAFFLLRKKRFLQDSKQDPAIRVALRAIRDFAIPFKKDNEIFWRYLTTSENEFEEKLNKKKEENIEKIITPNIEVKQNFIKEPLKKEETTEEKKESSKQEDLNIFEESTPKDIHQENTKTSSPNKPEKIQSKKTSKKIPPKKHDKFFNTIKESLLQKGIEILDIQDFNKDEITLLVKENGKENLLIAYNKKRIDETDIIKTSQKASKLNLNYIIISKGEPLRKTSNLIEAIKNLNKIETLE